jgi:hypothetical protein
MSGANVNLSVSNLPQIDRHQNDIHKNPVVNQEQNAKIAINEISQKLTKPVEAESTQGKNIDPNQKREESAGKAKPKKLKSKKEVGKETHKSNDEGYIVDFQA